MLDASLKILLRNSCEAIKIVFLQAKKNCRFYEIIEFIRVKHDSGVPEEDSFGSSV